MDILEQLAVFFVSYWIRCWSAKQYDLVSLWKLYQVLFKYQDNVLLSMHFCSSFLKQTSLEIQFFLSVCIFTTLLGRLKNHTVSVFSSRKELVKVAAKFSRKRTADLYLLKNKRNFWFLIGTCKCCGGRILQTKGKFKCKPPVSFWKTCWKHQGLMSTFPVQRKARTPHVYRSETVMARCELFWQR